MAKNGIKDLRNLMMETIERLLDDEDPMDWRTAQAIASVGNVVVGSAKVQLQIARLQGKTIHDDFNGNVPKQIEGQPPKEITHFSQADKCVQTAMSHGHTKDDANNCENYSVGCPDCPFK